MRYSFARAWRSLFCFSVFSLVVTFAALTLGNVFFPTETLPASVSADARVTVIIDAGHGGRDGGASSADGALEKDLNLAVAQKLEALLALADVQVVMTRREDVELALPTSDHKKRDDLNARLKMANGYENAIFVSIHMNTFPVSRYSGLQVYYSDNHEGSERLAARIQADARSLQAENERKIKAAGDGIYLLSHLKIPAVLVECGFLSNPDEAALLQTQDYQQKLALSLYTSILTYLTESL